MRKETLLSIQFLIMLFIATQCHINASDLVCAVYCAQSCHNIEKAIGL